jgi:hypothetical protein
MKGMYTIQEKFLMFLDVLRIDRPVEGCRIGRLHTYSAWKCFQRWGKGRNMNTCSHFVFINLLKENGFELYFEDDTYVVIDADLHIPFQKIISYVPRFPVLPATEYYKIPAMKIINK